MTSQNRPLKVLFAAAEATPLAKVGGLADVVGSLPKALRERGHDVRVIMPRYSCIAGTPVPLRPGADSFPVQSMRRQESAWLETGPLGGGVPVYFIGSHRYFERPGVYGEKDDLERFYFFSRAVVAALGNLDWQPDIIHCHDWHTAALPLWLKSQKLPYASLFTIHNLAYQGPFDDYFMSISELGEEWKKWLGNAPIPPLTMMSQGILQAEAVSTVSPTYAKEILTPEYGAGLEVLLRYRQDRLFGIVNGIDYQEFNPAADSYIAARYDASTLEKKAVNKAALQKRANLPLNPEVPLMGMVSRLDEQKGFDLLEKAIPTILKRGEAQLVILGKGRPQYETSLSRLAKKYPSKMALFLAFDNPLAHLIYAGCDMFLMPSRFEPCGLGQLIAMRYGTIPIVRHTGGLVDTVEDTSPNLERGRGFVFRTYDPEAVVEAVKWALVAFKRKEAWRKLVARVMGVDLSWQASAGKYEDLYLKVLSWKKGHS